MAYQLDHLVISAANLQEGRLWAESLLEVQLSGEGKHARMATHNHLIAMAPEAYLEVIATDPDAPQPDRPRWFDLDNFGGPPRLSHWVIRCDDLEEAWERAPADVGEILEFVRGDYAWRMIVPPDGRLPFDGCFPALIEWHSPHPAPQLPDPGLLLRRFTLAHPKAEALGAAIAPFVEAMENVRIVPAETPQLRAEIHTAAGEIWLS